VSRTIEVLPEAERETRAAFDWYERRRAGLGFEFLLALNAAVAQLSRLPGGHEVVALRTRKILLRRFPYLLLYAVEERRIIVTALFHGSRDPIRWSDRVREHASPSLSWA
jgi:plasmid stabilization system protein ParE